MGLVQLFVEVKNSPDDDFFTDPAGLENTTPLPLCFGDGDDSDEDEEEEDGEGEEEEEEEEELKYLDRIMYSWGSRWPHSFDDGQDGEDAHRPYRFTADPTLDIDNRRVAALGQNAAYAEILMTRQFRTCVFSLSISGRFVRFLRWDREGVVVSQAVDYKADLSLPFSGPSPLPRTRNVVGTSPLSPRVMQRTKNSFVTELPSTSWINSACKGTTRA